ncbi:MAG TPA: ribokinase [Acetobacteraceae bacterium]|nr:ribokinase [Acetobacteraceae bacterium]
MRGIKPVLVIGSLNMDLVVRCEHLPQPGQTIFGTDFFTAAGGKGANQAVAAARLGASVTMAGCVGDDPFGRDLVAALRADSICSDNVRVMPRPTGTALITVDAQGANTIVVASGANVVGEPALAEHALAAIGRPGILLLQHEIPDEVNAQAVRTAHRAGWFIVLNPAPARRIAPELLPLIDLVAPNETEAASLTGSGDPAAAAQHLIAQGARAVLVTLGSQGAYYRDTRVALHCPAVPVQAVDTTAAGDAYVGALAAALAEGLDIAEALGFAAAAAGLAVTRLGAQPSLGSADEVRAFIRQFGMPVAKPATNHQEV